jgi:hypothetical protein
MRPVLTLLIALAAFSATAYAAEQFTLSQGTVLNVVPLKSGL